CRGGGERGLPVDQHEGVDVRIESLDARERIARNFHGGKLTLPVAADQFRGAERMEIGHSTQEVAEPEGAVRYSHSPPTGLAACRSMEWPILTRKSCWPTLAPPMRALPCCDEVATSDRCAPSQWPTIRV